MINLQKTENDSGCVGLIGSMSIEEIKESIEIKGREQTAIVLGRALLELIERNYL